MNVSNDSYFTVSKDGKNCTITFITDKTDANYIKIATYYLNPRIVLGVSLDEDLLWAFKDVIYQGFKSSGMGVSRFLPGMGWLASYPVLVAILVGLPVYTCDVLIYVY